MKRLVLTCVLTLAACAKPAVVTVPLPEVMPSMLGPIPVVYVDSIIGQNPTQYVVGSYDYYRRRILLRRDTKGHPATAWAVAYHEWCHAALMDVGFRAEAVVTEMFCDAIALSRTRELLPHLPPED